jgi:arabinofuranosyltransferase
VVGSWLLWKHAYYGSWLPNSYYAKGAMFSLDILKGGVLYLFGFFLSYCLLPIAFLLLFMFREILAGREIRVLACICALWCLYIMRVGGDFMEYRFVVPILPFIFVLAAATLRALRSWRMQAALVTAILVCSLFHAFTFRGTPGVESVPKLRDYIIGESGRWELAGRVLGDLFPEGGVTIATTAAGAIPYYSKLPAVDMLGMNDAWVARNGAIIGPRAGHRRAATLAYLVERGVNLVIGHPLVEQVEAPSGTGSEAGLDTARYSIADLKKMFMVQNADADLLPVEAKIVEIPLDEEHRIVVLYLKGNARVDAVIEEKNFPTFPIAR